jgi:8-oxo-dGTP pyrophosphatase MutT (NUDIX family)
MESTLFENVIREHADDVENVRAGVVIRKKGTKKVLGLLGWGKPKLIGGKPQAGSLDLPKGHLTEGDSVEEGVRREAREECGLDLGEITLIDKFQYGSKPNSWLYVYYAIVDFDFADVLDFEHSGKCNKFENIWGKTVPEMVDACLVEIGNSEPFYKSLRPILDECFEWISAR